MHECRSCLSFYQANKIRPVFFEILGYPIFCHLKIRTWLHSMSKLAKSATETEKWVKLSVLHVFKNCFSQGFEKRVYNNARYYLKKVSRDFTTVESSRLFTIPKNENFALTAGKVFRCALILN